MTVAPRGARRGSCLGLLLAVAAVVLSAVWCGGAIPNRDPLWFYPAFDARPSRLTVYAWGTVVELTPWEADFEDLVPIINSTITRAVGYREGFTPSEASVDSYRGRGLAVEVAYPGRTLLHSRHFFPEFDHLFLPLDGTYNYLRQALLFRSLNGVWGGGALILEDNSRLRIRAEQLRDTD